MNALVGSRIVNKCQNCKHYAVSQETYYNPFHGGNPGSTDYEYTAHWCRLQRMKWPRRRLKCFEEKDTSNDGIEAPSGATAERGRLE